MVYPYYQQQLVTQQETISTKCSCSLEHSNIRSSQYRACVTYIDVRSIHAGNCNYASSSTAVLCTHFKRAVLDVFGHSMRVE